MLNIQDVSSSFTRVVALWCGRRDDPNILQTSTLINEQWWSWGGEKWDGLPLVLSFWHAIVTHLDCFWSGFCFKFHHFLPLQYAPSVWKSFTVYYCPVDLLKCKGYSRTRLCHSQNKDFFWTISEMNRRRRRLKRKCRLRVMRCSIYHNARIRGPRDGKLTITVLFRINWY